MTSKIISILLLISALMLPTAMKADQSGDMTLGLGGGYTTVNHSGYTDIYFRYSFASHVRISPHVGYVFKHEDASTFKVDIDMQFPFQVSRGVQLFPSGGVSFNNWNYMHGNSDSHFGLNAGAGVDLKFTPTLRLSLTAAYTFIKNASGLYTGIGIGYNF